MLCAFIVLFFFFKQKTAYEMRISDWSSDVCSSDLDLAALADLADLADLHLRCDRWVEVGQTVKNRLQSRSHQIQLLLSYCPETPSWELLEEIGRASCRERVCQYG